MNVNKVAWQIGPSTAPYPPVFSPGLFPPEMINSIGSMSAFFLHGYRQMGPIFRFFRDKRHYTVIVGPEANQFIANEGKMVFSAEAYRREQNEELGIEKTLVSLNGPEHYELRKLQKRGFARSTVHPRLSQLVEIVVKAVERWQEGEVFKATEMMTPIIAQQLGVGVVNYGPGDYFLDITHFVRTVVLETVARIRPKQAIYTPEYQQAKARVMELADKVIAMHSNPERNMEQPDLVDDLLAAIVENPDLMSSQELRIAVLGPYIGGLDTVAHTCAFIFYSLLKNGELLAEVVNEVDKTFVEGGDTLTPALLRNMPLLNAVAMETMRMYPVSPAIQGNVSQPFEFAGYRVDMDDNLIVGVTVPHFLPDYHPDPYKFDIGRFLPPRNEHQKPGALVPYGLGEHICLGAGIAEMLITVTMATILHCVTLELVPANYQLRIEATPTPTPAGMQIKVNQKRISSFSK